MSEDILYPEEIKVEALYRPITIRNFNSKVLKDLKHIATDTDKTLSDVLNAAGKEYAQNHGTRFACPKLPDETA